MRCSSIPRIDRRQWLKEVAAPAAAGLAVGCAPRAGRRQPEAARRFAPGRVSRERIIRTAVGLRPYRPSGFVLKAERLSDTFERDVWTLEPNRDAAERVVAGRAEFFTRMRSR